MTLWVFLYINVTNTLEVTQETAGSFLIGKITLHQKGI